jgi:hypothetical protein
LFYCGNKYSFIILKNPITLSNKSDCHDMTEILLKVALNTIKPKNKVIGFFNIINEYLFPQ